MVKITHGKNSQSISEISEVHWKDLNPLNKDKSYHQSQSLIGRINSIKKQHEYNGRTNSATFYSILLDNSFEFIKRIITCDVSQLTAVIIEVKELLEYCNLLNQDKIEDTFALELLNDIFQYDNWRSNGKGNEMFDLIGISVCPYCNIGHVFFDDDAGKLIVSYDHYYDKANYPFLALTFSNLIPSCSTCNQNYKSIFQFNTDTHLHPYLDDYNTRCTFRFVYTEYSNRSNILIDIEAENDIRSGRYNLDFSLAARYNLDDIHRNLKMLYHLALQYDETNKISMLNLTGLQNIREVEKEICGKFNIPFHPMEILQTQYGKLRRDIAKETGLLTT